MITHRQYTNEQFEQSFSDCSFNASLFSHEAHLRLGFIHIIKYGLPRAIENHCLQIQAFEGMHGLGNSIKRLLLQRSK